MSRDGELPPTKLLPNESTPPTLKGRGLRREARDLGSPVVDLFGTGFVDSNLRF